MHKLSVDPKVKKTFVRDTEMKMRGSNKKQVFYEFEGEASSSKYVNEKLSSRSSFKENVLSQPSLCSSDALANYLSDAKKTLTTPHLPEETNVDKDALSAQMTKKLNFHFNDKIYKNLIELNANIEELKMKKDKRPASSISTIKKDLEPNIEDFHEEKQQADSPPNIPIVKPTSKPIRTYENGSLHKLVARFEDL